jgi:heptosyltransferase-3
MVHKLLVIKLRAVGDVILSTAVLPNLRAAFPRARIEFLTEGNTRDVLVGNETIDELIVFKKSGLGGLNILFELRRRTYDLVIDLFGNPRSALMTFATGAKYRVGYDFRGRSYAYTTLVKPRGGEVHNVEFNLDALRRIDIPIVDRTIRFPLGESDDRFAEMAMQQLGLGSGMIVGLNPGTNRPTERWPAEKFAQLGNLLNEKYNASILVFWGPGEKPLAGAIAQRIRKGAVVAPPTTLKQLGSMFKRCTVVVSNDSGPMHIAAAVGVPTVGVFGPVNPRLQGPYGENTAYVTKEGLDCLGCNLDKHCPIGNVCMTQLEATAVLVTVEQLLKRCNLLKGQ